MSAAHAQRALAALQRARARGLAVEVKVTRPGSGGTYNPGTGEWDGAKPGTTHTGLGVVDSYRASDIDGTRVIQGDQLVYAEAVNLVRTLPGEAIEVAGRNCTAVSLEAIAPGGVDVLYILQVRGL